MARRSRSLARRRRNPGVGGVAVGAFAGGTFGLLVGEEIDRATDPNADDPNAAWQRKWRYVSGAAGAILGAMAGRLL